MTSLNYVIEARHLTKSYGQNQVDGGTVRVDGHDVTSEADKVRAVIGLTGQAAAVDELLTGRENLVMMGQLYRLTTASAREFSATVIIKDTNSDVKRALDVLAEASITVQSLAVHKPTLDDVFLTAGCQSDGAWASSWWRCRWRRGCSAAGPRTDAHAYFIQDRKWPQSSLR